MDLTRLGATSRGENLLHAPFEATSVPFLLPEPERHPPEGDHEPDVQTTTKHIARHSDKILQRLGKP